MATNPLFKSLTIDGTTMQLDDNLGQGFFQSARTRISTANTDLQGATLTVTEPGSYLLMANWGFNGASSTGSRQITCSISIKTNGESAWGGLAGTSAFHGNINNYSRLQTTGIYVFTSAQVPAQVAVFGRASITTATGVNDYNSIAYVKLIRT